jgi:sulfoxide reductase heme-binding subunit YedZ
MTNGPDVQGHAFWLLSRSAGVVALVLVAVSVLIGLTLAAGLGGPPQRRRALVAIHEHSALASLIAIATHGLALLPDPFLKPGIAGIAVPFAIDYKPAFVAAGIVGGYLAAALGLSFYARRRIGGKRWRKLHRATPVVYVLGMIHTLGAGTDAGSTWLRAFMLATAVPAVGLLVVRLRKKPARRPAPAMKGVNA